MWGGVVSIFSRKMEQNKSRDKLCTLTYSHFAGLLRYATYTRLSYKLPAGIHIGEILHSDTIAGSGIPEVSIEISRLPQLSYLVKGQVNVNSTSTDGYFRAPMLYRET